MECVSSLSRVQRSPLQERTRAVQELASHRSALPPAMTAAQLLSVLREAAELLPPDAVQQESPAEPQEYRRAPSSAPPAAYSAYILRQCPTQRRVHSSFAAAGAHSALGEMLQFFATAVTCLLSDGPGAEAALAFPAEWERRLNLPEAAALRQSCLYELQGFSALFTYMWGHVAAYRPCVPAEARVVAAEDEGEAARAPLLPQLAPLPQVAAPSRAHLLGSQLTAPSAATSSAAPARSKETRPVNAAYDTPDRVEKRSSGKRERTRAAPPAAVGVPSVVSPPSQRQPLTAMVAVADATHHPTAPTPTTAASLQSQRQPSFLPSLTLTGLSATPQLSTSVEPTRNPTHRSLKGLTANATHPTAPPLSAAATQAAIAQAMEDDRARQLQRSLGVATVRNYAKEADMQQYLASFQRSMQSVWEEEDEGNGV